MKWDIYLSDGSFFDSRVFSTQQQRVILSLQPRRADLHALQTQRGDQLLVVFLLRTFSCTNAPSDPSPKLQTNFIPSYLMKCSWISLKLLHFSCIWIWNDAPVSPVMTQTSDGSGAPPAMKPSYSETNRPGSGKSENKPSSGRLVSETKPVPCRESSRMEKSSSSAERKHHRSGRLQAKHERSQGGHSPVQLVLLISRAGRSDLRVTLPSPGLRTVKTVSSVSQESDLKTDQDQIIKHVYHKNINKGQIPPELPVIPVHCEMNVKIHFGFNGDIFTEFKV